VIAACRVESESAFEALVHESLEDSASVVVRLDSELAARGLHPAIDASRSRTLGEEALVDSERRRTLESMRGVMRSLDPTESWEFLAEKAREPRWGDAAELPDGAPG
jgi:transcription termination factor Rho